MKPFRLFAVVQPGLEDLAANELRALGVKNPEPVKGGFEFIGHFSTIIRLNLGMRIVSHLLLRLGEFPARNFGELARHFEALPWDDFLQKMQPSIRVLSFRSDLFHEGAVADRLGRILGHGGKDLPVQPILVRIAEDQAQVSLDTGGEHLHKRGYADWRTPAPLRENVAAALVRVSGWNGEPLVDPMCGSGTIVLEAWGQACGIPVHRLRDFAFNHWQIFDPTQWQRWVYEPIARPELRIHGYDIDPEAIRVARHNRENLGANVEFEVQDVRELKLHEPTWILCNPPYGKRLDENRTSLAALTHFRDDGHRLFILAPEKLLRESGHICKPMLHLKNGAISVVWAEILEKAVDKT